MADSTVVTELIIDASGAEAGSANFIRAAKAAQQVADSLSDSTFRAQKAIDANGVSMIGHVDSVGKVRTAYERLQASVDPVYKAQLSAQAAIEKATLTANDAVIRGITSQTQAASVVDAVTKKQNAYVQSIKEQTGQLTAGERVMSAFGGATSGVSAQLVAMAAGAGPVGVFLSALGPWGLAAAVGLSAVGSAITYVAEESLRMGETAIALRAFSVVTGLTITQLTGLRSAGAEFGITGDAVGSAFERLTAQFSATRQATGTLFIDIQKVNGSLADELRRSTTAADSINILAKAYNAAGDEAQKAAIARAAFGRQGASLGPLLGGVADAGGIDNLTKSTKDLSVATDDQMKRWATMTAQIDETKKLAQNILASIITPAGLEAQKLAADRMLDMAKAAAELARQQDGLTVWQKFWAAMAAGGNAEEMRIPDLAEIEKVNQSVALLAARQRIAAGNGTNLASPQSKGTNPLGVDQKDIDSWLALSNAFRAITAPAEAASKSLHQLQDDATAAANAARERIAFLGSAATANEREAEKLAALNAAYLDNKVAIGGASAMVVDWLKHRAESAISFDTEKQGLAAYLSVLGPAASVQDQVRAAMVKVTDAQKLGAVFTKEQIANVKQLATQHVEGVLAINQQTDALRVQAATFGLSAGAAAMVHAQMTFQLQDLRDHHIALGPEIADREKAIALLGQQTDATAKLNIENQIGFERKTVFLTPEDLAIVQKLAPEFGQRIPDALASAHAADLRFIDGLKTLNTEAGNFASSFAQDIQKGVDPFTALTNAAQKLETTLIDMAAKKLASAALSGLFGSVTETAGLDAGSTSAAAILTAGGTAAGAAIVAAATTAAGILGFTIPAAATTLPVAGAATGTEVAVGGATAGAALAAGGAAAGTAIWGPIAALAAAAIALGAVLFGSSKSAAKQAAEQAQQQNANAWAAMQTQFNTLVTTLSGGATGTVKSAMDAATQSMLSFIDAAKKAGDAAGVAKALGALDQQLLILAGSFNSTFEAMLSAFSSGVGASSPFMAANDNVKKIGATLQGFLADTSQMGDDLGRARTATQAYALSLLQVAPALSATQTALLTLQGNAAALNGVLLSLGMSADQAAASIRSGVNQAMTALSDQFQENIAAKIASAVGKNYINDLNTLVTEVASLKQDAASLGLSTAQVSVYFAAQAQSIVNGAQLTGDAFNQLITQFPQLSGLVTQFSAAVTRTAAQILSTQQGYQDQLFIDLQDQTTLTGQLAAFDLQAQRAREAEAAAGGQALVDLEALQAQQRLDVVTKFNTAALAATQQALTSAQTFLANFTNSVKSYLANLLGGAGSPLSPQDALASAQSSFNSQYTLATSAGGQAQQDALSSITQYATTLINAAKAYDASSPAYQAIVSAVEAQLSALPTQVTPEQLIVSAVNASTAAIQAMQAALVAAVNTGSPAQIALALLPEFTALTANTNGMLTFSEFDTALHGLASEATIQSVWNAIDTTGASSISRLDLINTATGTTGTNTGSAVTELQTANTQFLYLGTMVTLLSTINTSLSGMGVQLNTISSATQGTEGQAARAANNLQAQNLARVIPSSFTSSPISAFASGGWASGGTPGLDSIRAWLTPGEFVVNPSASRRNGPLLEAINSGADLQRYGAGNDNSSAAEIRALRSEVASLRSTLESGFQRVVQAEVAGAEHVREGVDQVAQHAQTTAKAARRVA